MMLSWIRNRRCATGAAVTPRTRLELELLEERAVPSTVYVESNNPDLGENAVLAFHRDSTDGSLTQIGTYPTGGTGQLNLPKILGPDDSDQEVVATPDGRFLFAVNQGSNSITSFGIGSGGGLDFIGTFDSGGVQPASLGISGNRLYVANRGDVTANQDGTVAPNYTGFSINDDGSLTPIAGSTVTLPVGTSPAQALVSRTGRFLFADIFGIPGNPAPQSNTIAPLVIRPDGSLELATGGNISAPVDPPLLLGTASHPTLNILYAGLTGANEIGVFTYNETGRLEFVTAVPDLGAAACWCVVSVDGQYLYVATTGTDSIGVFSLADPLHPVQIEELALRHGLGDGQQTADFQIALDPSGQSLYVVNQSTNPTGTNHRGNQLHMLSVAADGTVREEQDPIVFSPADVPANAHPQGVAVVDTADDPSPRGFDFASALLTLLSGGQTNRAGEPSSTIPFTIAVSPLGPRGTERLAFLLSPNAVSAEADSDVRSTVRAERGEGQPLDLAAFDATSLDAVFASDVRGSEAVPLF
jgi:6-phosphogluconolactonase (cycloisomerase 2 family)